MSNPSHRLAAALSDRYTIERELGVGGMATVYLAHDVKHARNVALKVLHPDLAATIGVERFLSEIKVTANLQHPNILGLFDSGIADGQAFYVMPYMEGESLRDRLQREKQLPVADALRIAAGVAAALEYAHAHGVIHRDIKPENILLQSGQPVVADFGIALAVQQAGEQRLTQTGMSLGTPQYMSPEQAMGERTLDARTDIYALGVITYEMLAGEPPFSGPNTQAIVARVLTEKPRPLAQLRDMVNPAVEAAVHQALQKLPADRQSSAAAFAAALAAPTPDMPATGPVASVHTGKHHALPWVAALVVTAAAAFFLGNRTTGGHLDAPVVLGRATHVTWDPTLEVMPALSPDEKSVAYLVQTAATTQVMVRTIAGGRALALTGDTANDEWNPVWLPDGSRILFLARGGVYSAPAGGGPARPEIPATSGDVIWSVTPSPDGTRLAFARGDSLLVREADGSIHGLAGMLQPVLCNWSPDGEFIACGAGNGLYAQSGINLGNLSPGWIMLCRLSDGQLTTVTDSLSLNTSPTWSPDSRWIHFISNRDGPRDIYTVPITRNGRAAGSPIRLSAGLGALTISSGLTGTALAYSLYSIGVEMWGMPMPTHAGGTTTGAVRITNSNENIETINASPDGKWLYYDTDLTGDSEIFRTPTAGGEPERLTTNAADDFSPVVSPDNTSFAFHSWRSGSRDIFVQELDGSGIVAVTQTPSQEAWPNWSPDGSALTFAEVNGRGALWIVSRDAQGRWGTPQRRLDHGAVTLWSPDGRRIAMFSTPSAEGIEVVPVDSGPSRIVYDASTPGALTLDYLQWANDATLLFSNHDGQGITTLYAVPTTGGFPVPFLRFDPALHRTFRGQFHVANGRLYFAAEERQGDVWVMELRKL